MRITDAGHGVMTSQMSRKMLEHRNTSGKQ